MYQQIRYSLISLLIVSTGILIVQYSEIGMIGLMTFILAYLSKGMRRN